MPKTGTHPRRLLRSTAAVLLGFVAVVVLSLGTDQVLHKDAEKAKRVMKAMLQMDKIEIERLKQAYDRG